MEIRKQQENDVEVLAGMVGKLAFEDLDMSYGVLSGMEHAKDAPEADRIRYVRKQVSEILVEKKEKKYNYVALEGDRILGFLSYSTGYECLGDGLQLDVLFSDPSQPKEKRKEAEVLLLNHYIECEL